MQLSEIPAHLSPAQYTKLRAPLLVFQQLYGDGEVKIWRAPARLNILGEHIDYVSYLPTASLPFGSHEHEMVLLYRPNESGLVRGASMNEKFAPFHFEVREGVTAQKRNWLDYLYSRPTPPPAWSNYVKGAVFYAWQKHGLETARGFDFIIASSIPPQGGSSSSSALVVLAGAAFRQGNELPFTPAELAADSAQAEWYVGTRGGALDHTTICLAKRRHAVHLRYADNQAELVPLPDAGYRWVTFFSHAADKGREIMLEYNERAAVSRLLIPAIIESWKTRDPNLFSTWSDVRDYWKAGVLPIDKLSLVLKLLPEGITLQEIRRDDPETFQQCQLAFPALVQERSQQPLTVRNRTLHHLGEVKRVEAAVKLLRESRDSEATMRALGELLKASHASLRDLYEVSTPRVNQLYEVIRSDAQVLGARLIGGGFGGNVLALTTTDNVTALIHLVQKDYYAPNQRDGLAEGAIMISTPGKGLSELV